MLKKLLGIGSVLFFALLLVVGCGGQETKTKEDFTIKLATTSTQDSGLLDVLLPEFTKDTGIKVDVLAQGTGQALKTAESGDADALLVHAKAKEEEFIAAGFGTKRQELMYNDFIIVGPKAGSIRNKVNSRHGC
ncbi:substrate-binding domain-containing protein [endosymbiont 'TC1' of Trimyema compressum]|uniref:substrate-binding domain-containing protein n=1 Tax=endosymbiont 'TC1' of Trimyema compressum TaxID=243899 RepID=UPI000AD622AD|nr:substrate-binding domain-containing protein [endosymbiont 'TC1' of Trimyema compressum]